MLKEYEEELLSMNFEVMLTQIVQMPARFMITSRDGDQTEEERREIEGQLAIRKFNEQMQQMEVRSMLLERLEREFSESFKQASQSKQL